MRACPWQNQHLSSGCFLILLKYSAERADLCHGAGDSVPLDNGTNVGAKPTGVGAPRVIMIVSVIKCLCPQSFCQNSVLAAMYCTDNN